VTSRFEHALDVLIEAGASMRALFGPEHGFGGEAQDMEPVAGVAAGPGGLPLHSLYGADESTLAPSPDLIRDLDVLVVDLADVGSRYYTFAWTAVLCLRACRRAGVDLVLLDRPNPLGGVAVEGAPQAPGYLSFVGLIPVPNRHGLTIGELTRLAAREEGSTDALTVVPMAGWERWMTFEDTGLPWVMPSPNMPTTDTASVYPGGCLLEATWASEGRGTTRPFELFGAPGIDGKALAETLTAMDLPGVRFRPVGFRPAFQKHAGRQCGGVQVHVVDRLSFRPYLTGVAQLLALRKVAGEGFEWRRDPYEFVTDVPAIDLLCGSPAVRELVEQSAPLEEIAETWKTGELEFVRNMRERQLYP
jgi:uncharacterized protein YbbC (DUF1343 family)